MDYLSIVTADFSSCLSEALCVKSRHKNRVTLALNNFAEHFLSVV